MDLWQLEVFCAVCEERSFSRAAERLALAQPTVSGHVRALETFFGLALLDRLGRETVPTRAGAELYLRAKDLLDEKRLTLEAMSRFAGGLEGELRIMTSTIPGEFLLPRLIVRFNRHHPGVRVYGEVGDSRAVIEAVAEGRADLGMAGVRPSGTRLELTPFASDHLVVAAPADERWGRRTSTSLAALKSEPLVVRERGSGTRVAFERYLEEQGHRLADFRVVAELGSTAAIKEAVRLGVGWSVVSDLALEAELAANLILTLPLDGAAPWRREFYLVRDPRRSIPPTVAQFLALARGEEDHVGPSPAAGAGEAG